VLFLEVCTTKRHTNHIWFSCLLILVCDGGQDLLNELNIGPNKHRVVRLSVMLAMDRHNAQRELTSQLISDLYRTVFRSDDIARGFNELLTSIDDIVLDTPDAPNVITFVASVVFSCIVYYVSK